MPFTWKRIIWFPPDCVETLISLCSTFILALKSILCFVFWEGFILFWPLFKNFMFFWLFRELCSFKLFFFNFVFFWLTLWREVLWKTSFSNWLFLVHVARLDWKPLRLKLNVFWLFGSKFYIICFTMVLNTCFRWHKCFNKKVQNLRFSLFWLFEKKKSFITMRIKAL